jgi:two-component system response regulator FixJ
MTNESTIYIVDDDEAVRESLQWMIESEGYSTEAYASADEFLAAFDQDRHGCLLLDVRMPGKGGLDLQQELADRNAIIPIIFITAHGTVPTAVRALKSGAVDFVMKPFNNVALLDRIRDTLETDKRTRERQKSNDVIDERLSRLTPREQEVMEMVIDGKSNKKIAAELDVSTKTVEAHRAKVMLKMQAGSVAELTRMVLQRSGSAR